MRPGSGRRDGPSLCENGTGPRPREGRVAGRENCVERATGGRTHATARVRVRLGETRQNSEK